MWIDESMELDPYAVVPRQAGKVARVWGDSLPNSPRRLEAAIVEDRALVELDVTDFHRSWTAMREALADGYQQYLGLEYNAMLQARMEEALGLAPSPFGKVETWVASWSAAGLLEVNR